MLQSIVCTYLKCFHNSLVASYRIIQRTQTFKFEYLRMLKTDYMHLCLSTLDIGLYYYFEYPKGTGAKLYSRPSALASTGAKVPVAPVESAPMSISLKI